MTYKYSHGGNAAFEKNGGGVTDLSANINPLGMPGGVKDAIISAISGCERYPDSFSSALCEKIAEFEGVRPGDVLCGNGASDIIFRLPPAAGAKKVLVTAPCFADYERAAASAGAEVARHVLYAENGFVIDESFAGAARRERPGLVFVCNPNNPTGSLTPRGVIERLLDECRGMGAYVAVDECFIDFSERAEEYTCKPLLGRYDNLVILKAFTKLFALPGIRLGYALCRGAALVDRLRFHGADWAVSNLAQAAGMAALDGAGGYIKETARYVASQRERLENGLCKLGYKVFKAAANYVFARNPYGFDLCAELDKKGVRVRACANFHALGEGYFRAAVSSDENNSRLLAAVAEITAANTGGNAP